MERKRIGGYELEQELGRGANGAVYRARSLANPTQQVALKVLFASSGAGTEMGRFRREVTALAELRHKNVVQLVDSGIEQGLTWLAMTLVRGDTLRELIRKQGALPNETAARVALGIAAGLEHAHGLGILHRDLKPHNVLIDPAGEPVLTDFGLARLGGGTNDRLTQTGEVLGTGPYLSPEQANGSHVDERADIYAAGATLFQMLTGQPPFKAPSHVNLVVKVLSSPPPQPSSMNPLVAAELEEICLRCLEKDPGDRYASAAELKADLERYLGGGEGEGGGVPAGLLVAGVVAVVLVAGATLAALEALAPTPDLAEATPSPSPAASVAPRPSLQPSPLASPSHSASPRPAESARPAPAASPASFGAAWKRDLASDPPSPRGGAGVATDTHRDTILVFGGISRALAYGEKLLGDTWLRRSGVWQHLAVPGPPARRSPASAYDARRREVVLFGGAGERAYLGDTWVWDGDRWSPRFGAGPSPRSHHAMAYDAKRGEVVLFGGRQRGLLNDTWVWDGQEWTERKPTTKPSVRRNFGMAYDPRREVVVLFGGMFERGLLTNETWEWDGERWTQRQLDPSPSARRIPGAMVYDPRLQACVVFGGKDQGGELVADTWAYDGERWRELPSEGGGPTGRHWVQLAWDSVDQQLILFGGQVMRSDGEVSIAEQWLR